MPRRSGAARSSSATGSSGRASASTPWGDSVRACASSRARGTVSTGTRMRPASSSIRSSCGEGSWSSASMIRRTVRRPTVSSSSTARRPSTWSPPSSLRGPGRRSLTRPPLAAGRGAAPGAPARGAARHGWPAGGSRRLHQHDGQAGDALGPAQRAEALGPGRLDRDRRAAARR